jgi:hypothetical protein
MNSRHKMTLILLTCCAGTSTAAIAAPAPCVPPPGFVDTPHPAVAPVEKLVSHSEDIVIHRPLEVVLDAESKLSLEKTIDRNSSLPSVSGTYMLTQGDYGSPGSRRLTCLTDGSSLVEEVLESGRDKNSGHFRYVVWNYTTEQARPIVYGVGHFVTTDIGAGETQKHWTYSFQLNRNRFPGYLGRMGDFLFRVGFLDRQYAKMMRGTLAGLKAGIEGNDLVEAPSGPPK